MTTLIYTRKLPNWYADVLDLYN